MIEDIAYMCSCCGARFTQEEDEQTYETRQRCIKHENECIANTINKINRDMYKKFNVEMVECCYNCKHGQHVFNQNALRVKCNATPSYLKIGPRLLKDAFFSPCQVCSRYEMADGFDAIGLVEVEE